MDRTTPTPQDTPPRDPPPERGTGADPHDPEATTRGTPLIALQAFADTVRHFFPDLNDWLRQLPDGRLRELCTYETHFMAWWGLWLFLGQLGSRRQLDFELEAPGTQVLHNLNLLAGTEHDTRPVHDTLEYFLGQLAPEGLPDVRTQMARRLCRMKVLDPARLLGHLVLLVDATGLFCWRRRHCEHCLTRRHGEVTLYQHQVLEAKLLGPAGVVVSVGSEFIDNRDVPKDPGSQEEVKQDCELKALDRLAPRLKRDFPQLSLVLAGDGLYACGRVLAIARQYDWHYVLTLKGGRLPTVWDEFQRLLPLCPRNRLERTLEDGTRQEYSWVKQLGYVDSEGRSWCMTAVQCLETKSKGETTRFAWITDLPVSVKTVAEIATKGGRGRWKIENEGFNRQKNSGLNLEHVYSWDVEKLADYYVLLQMAFVLTQLLERGSLLRQLSAELGASVLKLFGSLKNVARRLLEGLRQCQLEPADAGETRRHRISLEDSS